MTVTLRTRLRGDKEFYYLDFYDNGKRKREALSLFIYAKVGGLTYECKLPYFSVHSKIEF